MSESQISHLENEIARLNQIITVLLEQNAYLKQANSCLKTGLGNTQDINSHAEIEIGNQEQKNSYAGIDIGIQKMDDSQHKGDIGIKQSNDSYAEIAMGNQLKTDSQVEIVVGNQQKEDSQAKTDMGSGSATKPLPEIWTIDESSVKRVSARLKDAGFKNVKHSGKRNVAKILLHFHNKGKGGFAELHKVTGLSEGGIGKLMMSLQKRGVIYRTSYQHYALSGVARQVLQKAYQDNAKAFAGLAQPAG